MRHRVWYTWPTPHGEAEAVPAWTLWHRDYMRSPEGYQPDTDDTFPNFLEADMFAKWRSHEHGGRIIFQAFQHDLDPNYG